jgi:hypothetical protein
VEDVLSRKDTPSPAAQHAQTADAASAPPGTAATTHQQGEVRAPAQQPASAGQAASEALPAPVPAKRRRKKSAETVVESAETESKAAADTSQAGGDVPSEAGTAAPMKPRRPRRVGDPKPHRYAVGEREQAPSRGAEPT